MVYSLEEIGRRVRPIAEKYRLRAVYVFGSYARGEVREGSDIDFLLDISGTEIKSLLQPAAVYCNLEDAFEKRIDVVTVESLEQKPRHPSQQHFHQIVLSERAPLYVAPDLQRLEHIRNMRNLVAHDYGNINQRALWNTIMTDIPVLKQFCEEQLACEP